MIKNLSKQSRKRAEKHDAKLIIWLCRAIVKSYVQQYILCDIEIVD